MKILGIETSVKQSSAAIVIENDSYEVFSDIKKDAAKSLPFIVENVLNKAQSSFNDIDGIAISMGPGSFTGLRIGLSYSKGLAFGCGLPIIPVPTLTAIMKSGGKFEGFAQVLLYSHRDIVYAQKFKMNNNLNPKNEIAAYQWEEIKNTLQEFDFVVHVGCDKLISEENNIKTGYTSSSIIAELANKYFDEWVVEKPYSVVPNYISPFNIGVKNP